MTAQLIILSGAWGCVIASLLSETVSGFGVILMLAIAIGLSIFIH